MKTSKNLYLLSILILLIIFIINYQSINKSIYKNEQVNNSFLIKELSIKGDSLKLILNNKETIIAFYKIPTKEEKDNLLNNLKVGQIINVVGEITTPEDSSIPNTFNYKKYLLGNKIKKILYIEHYQIIKEPSIIYNIKRKLSSNKTLITSYTKALIFADKDYINETVNNSYSINGISHLISISGMHINLLCLSIKKILNKLKVKNTNIIIALFLVFYLFLTNFSPTILRASLFMFLLTIFKNKLTTLKVLILTISIILALNPHLIYNLSFQYSAITSLFIVKLTKEEDNFIKQLINVSLIAFLAGLPITLYNFYQINLLSPLLNIIFVPFMTFIIYPITLITYIFPFLDNITIVPITVFEQLSILFSKFQYLIVNVPKINLISIIIYYLILLNIRFSKKTLTIPLVLILLAKIFPYIDPSGYIYYLDVGQGDSSLIISPYKKDITLIDTGGVYKFPKEEWQEKESISLAETISTFLKSLGITSIDNVILSHGDYDHLGESIELSKLITFKNVCLNKGVNNEIEEYFKNYQCNYNYKFMTNQTLDTKKYDNENDNSIISLITIYNKNFLYMADASIKVEKDLLNNYNFPNIEILKIGHHGSNTSSSEEFINTINPKHSIISAGLNNRYNHPNKEVIDILNENKTNILNTINEQTIIFKITKYNVTKVN